ncbi:MAG: glycosyltransferase family 39 protein, partial [Pseudomonadota bacterium]
MLIGVVAVMFALRLTVGASMHLTEDEAYYRLWSMAPAFGYYDHPPMIAWWIWLGRRLLGDTPLGVRIGPIVAGALTTALVFDLARVA